jgi:hypothetical protein
MRGSYPIGANLAVETAPTGPLAAKPTYVG